MANISIADFKNNFQGGTRENRFVVVGNIPFNYGKLSRFHIVTTQMPTVATQTIGYDFFGRKKYYPGEKQYATQTFRILDDTGPEGNLWKSFQNWQNKINEHKTNKSYGLSLSSDYKAYGWKLHHLNLNGDESNPLKTFIFHGCWPKVVDSMILSMANPNSHNEFNVVLIYDWVEIEGITKR